MSGLRMWRELANVSRRQARGMVGPKVSLHNGSLALIAVLSNFNLSSPACGTTLHRMISTRLVLQSECFIGVKTCARKCWNCLVDAKKHVSSEVKDGVMVIKINSPGSKVLLQPFALFK